MARYLLLGGIGLAFLAVLVAFLIGNRTAGLAKQPKLGLMTTLPLFWGEGDIEDIVQQPDAPLPAYQRLAAKYQIRPIEAIDPHNLKSMHMLLLAQSRALAPKEFVALDNWVRRGGHLMIMADPALQWESAYPLGDKRRPLFTSMMSPLFGHWGLELVLPIGEAAEGPVIRQIGGLSLRTITPGAWQQAGRKQPGACTIHQGGLVAECRIGKGSAMLIADADLLHEQFWTGSGVRLLSGADDFDNMRWIEENLDRLWAHE